MKLRRSLALMMALGGLAASTVAMSEATAQTPAKPKTTTPDDTKKADKKADDKKAVGKIEIYDGKKGWRFRIKNDEDKVIAMPTKSYEKKEDMLKELDLVKTIVNTQKPVEVKEKE